MKEYFCENCNVLTETDVCHVCGRKNLPTPTENDFCFFTDISAFYGKMLEEVFDNNQIKYAVIPLRTSYGYGALSKESDKHRIFVVYRNYDEAAELFDELFGEN